MTPLEIASDAALRARFQEEVAYLDRPQPEEDEREDDTKILKSDQGVLVVAWLWPDPFYGDDDPFTAAADLTSKLQENARKQAAQRDAAGTTGAYKNLDDQFRRYRRRRTARRVSVTLNVTAKKTARSVDDLTKHLEWTTSVGPNELRHLIDGRIPFPLAIILEICEALQLEFMNGVWKLNDPQGLARRIDQSVLAHGIATHMRTLTHDNLESLAKKLPRPTRDNPDQGPETYYAPKPGARYWSLYEALAEDTSDNPTYTLTALDQILENAGEGPLPDSATADKSWWAGNGTRTEGRPQLTAWWAAGYRIQSVKTDPTSGNVEAIDFAALPGRSEWLTTPDRITAREYRLPAPETVDIFPDYEAFKVGLKAFATNTSTTTTLSNLNALTSALSTFARQISNHVSTLDIEQLQARVAELARQLSTNPNDEEAKKELAIIGDQLDTASPNPPPNSEPEPRRAQRVLEHLQTPPRTSAIDDPDIQLLIEFLRTTPEADRATIEEHFRQTRTAPFDAPWLTNLLTKARRQGLTTNEGTRSQPRWKLVPTTTEIATAIADTLDLPRPNPIRGGAISVDFLQKVAETMGIDTTDKAKHELMQAIVESTGGAWQPEYLSPGATITKAGMAAIQRAAQAHVAIND